MYRNGRMGGSKAQQKKRYKITSKNSPFGFVYVCICDSFSIIVCFFSPFVIIIKREKKKTKRHEHRGLRR